MDRRLFLVSALALAGCTSLGPLEIAPALAPLGELEPLYGVRQSADGLVIRVASNGCTTKDDFAFHVDRGGRTLAFARRRLDTCDVAPQSQAELTFGWAELGLSGGRVGLLNPLITAGRGD